MKRQGMLWSPLLLAASSACRVTPDYERPALSLPERFVEAESGTPPAPPPPQLDRWWTLLGDPLLSDLVERARAQNLDLRRARERVLEARAAHDRVRGTSGPRIDAQAGASWLESSTNLGNSRFGDPDPTQFHQAGFDASWELDLFGRNARAVEAAGAGAEAAEEDARAVQVSLCAEVARQYVELRAAQEAAALTRANLEAQLSTVELVGVRARAQMASDLDLARAEAQAASTRALLPQLEARASAARHGLAVLLGLAPGALNVELASAAEVPEAPVMDAAGVPADLLLRRPDLRGAERELAGAAALSSEARAELFPRISLGAALGLQANRVGDLLDGDSKTFSVGPGLFAPLFQSGALRANVRAQDARAAQARLRYEQAVLNALREVEDALVAADRERARQASLAEALAASRRALGLAQDMQRTGLADFFDVLEAQRTALTAETALAESRGRLCTNTLLLYKALGGGWSE